MLYNIYIIKNSWNKFCKKHTKLKENSLEVGELFENSRYNDEIFYGFLVFMAFNYFGINIRSFYSKD